MPFSIGGWIVASEMAERVEPLHVTGRSLQQLHEQRQLVLEELLVPGQVVPEERVRLGKRSAAENHFRASVRQGIERREPLEHTNGIVRAQDRDGRSEQDPLRPGGNRREHDLRRRDREIGTMVFADAERVETEIIGQDGFFDDLAEHAGLRLERAVRRERDVAERIETEFELDRHSASSLSRGTVSMPAVSDSPARLDDRPGR